MAHPGAPRRFKRILAVSALLLSASAAAAPILMQPLPGAPYTPRPSHIIHQPYPHVQADIAHAPAGNALGGSNAPTRPGPPSPVRVCLAQIALHP
ncbi:hypothetical protein, partial [Achromobacter ruhlandii]|uniref:hypothetical protein n=1 Tax=Achromobacter ruhlandii TaxID=72557 RepID=UPI001B8D0149